jgi:hypothetical protein
MPPDVLTVPDATAHGATPGFGDGVGVATLAGFRRLLWSGPGAMREINSLAPSLRVLAARC